MAARNERERHVARGALEPRRPERLAGSQAGDSRHAPRREHTISHQLHRPQQGRGPRAEHHRHAVARADALELDPHVLEAAGREQQLDGTAHRLAIERLARRQRQERREPCRVLRLDAHAAHRFDFARSGGGCRERQRKEGGEHQRDCLIRTSKAQPRSTPVRALPGSVRVSSSE